MLSSAECVGQHFRQSASGLVQISRQWSRLGEKAERFFVLVEGFDTTHAAVDEKSGAGTAVDDGDEARRFGA